MFPIRFGSASSNHHVFDHETVAEQHAEIIEENGQLVLVDKDTAFGTYLDGKAVKREPVRVGQEVGLGAIKFKLRLEHVVGVTSPAGQGEAKPQLEPTEREGIETGEVLKALGGEEGEQFEATRGRGIRVERADDARDDEGSEPTSDSMTVDISQMSGVGYQLPSAEFDSTIAVDMVTDRGPRHMEFEIGRADDNDIVVPAPQVSGHHCVVWFSEDGWRARDLASTNGTFINIRDTPIEPGVDTPIREKDVLFLGSYRLPMARVVELAVAPSADQTVKLPLHKDIITIGRGPGNDVVLDAPSVSRQHAELHKTSAGWELTDLASANGTFVNGGRIAKQIVTSSDALSFGSYFIRLDLDTGLVHKEYQGEIKLQAEGISIDVPDKSSPNGKKRILEDVSFTAYPTELIGIMGPSGAGKTTLLMALNGYMVPSEGHSLINNVDLYQHYNQFRGNIGYVPQDDIIHKELTVFESLYYTAKLRLPPDTKDEEIDALVTKILKELGIEDTRNVLIGSPLKKGISGGQRKRVNLAQELLTQPSLLFLDEPTSGLASSDTIGVIKLMRRLADAGRTIMLTIHQPSLVVYSKMDNVLYLARGKLMYYGPAHPDSITYFNPDVDWDSDKGQRMLTNPDNAMIPLAMDSGSEQWPDLLRKREREYDQSKYYKDYVEDRREDRGQVQIVQSSKEKVQRRFGFRQWLTLTRRNFTIKRKDTANLAILLAQAPIIALLVSLVFSQAGSNSGEPEGIMGPFMAYVAHQSSTGINSAALFMLVASAAWFGTSNAAKEIVGELAIYRRERMVNLKIPSFVLSKFTVLAALSFVQCTILLGIAYPLLGFHGSFFKMLIILTLCALGGLSFGLVLSALVKSTEAATAMVPLLLIPQFVLGGLIVPISDFDRNFMRTGVRYVANLMVARWTFEGLLHVEEANRPPPEPIEVSEEEKKMAAKYWDKPYKPSLIRVAGKRKVSEERQMLTKAFIKTIIAEGLNERQEREKSLERYFGRFTTSFTVDCLVLIFYSMFLLALVCLLLRMKDMKT